jgi:hypothetical protein
MRKHIPHPVTRLTSRFAQLDILHGGKENQAIEESLKIARDLRDVLKDEENILYVNTLVSEARLQHIKGKSFDHGARRGRNFFVTYRQAAFMMKLEPLGYMVRERKIKYLVLNGFELAALNPRHRMEFMGWIRGMRNDDVNVILFTINCPTRYGSLGSLGYSARSVEEVGAYLEIDKEKEEVQAGSIEHDEFDAVTSDDIESNDIETAEVFEGFHEENEEPIKYASEIDYPDEDVLIVYAPPSEKDLQLARDHGVTMIYAGPPVDEAQHSDEEVLKTKELAIENV